MLFQSNPLQYQCNLEMYQKTAEPINALRSSKMQSMHYDIIYNVNLLNSLHRFRLTPQEVVHCKYYMEALNYLMSIATPNPRQCPCSNLSSVSMPFNQPFPRGNYYYDVTAPNSMSIASSSSSSPKEEEDDKSQQLVEQFRQFYPVKKIGVYDWKTRVLKIIRYKVKQIQKQAKKPVVTKYSGRSKVASLKARYRGRFIRTNTKLEGDGLI